MTRRFRSMAEMFLHRIRDTPDAPAFLYPRDPEWKTLSWRETGERVRAIASGLRAIGVQDEERVAILSATRIEWILADLGIVCAGAATTTIYPANSVEELAYILDDSRAVAVFVETPELLLRLLARRSELPNLKHVILFDGDPAPDDWVMSLDALEARGREHAASRPDEFEATIARIEGDRLATLIYTSGTTGKPKGVRARPRLLGLRGRGGHRVRDPVPDDVQYLWLPMAHVFGRCWRRSQVAIGFPTAVDGRVDKLIENLAVVRPTFICGGAAHLRAGLQQGRGPGAAIGRPEASQVFRWAVGVGRRVSALRQQGRAPPAGSPCSTGSPTARVLARSATASADACGSSSPASPPLSREIAEFFHACGDADLEGYGLTESSAATFLNRPSEVRFGTVGLPMPGTEVQHRPGRRDPAARPRASCGAITACPRPRPRPWTPTAGCTPATSASSTRPATCASPTARRT